MGLLSLLALPLLLSGLLSGCTDSRAAEPAPPPTYQGVVEYDERALGFEVGGRVSRLDVERGSQVSLGDPVARLDDALARKTHAARCGEAQSAQAQLALVRAGALPEDVSASEARVRAARASEARLRRSLERERRLSERGVSPTAQGDDLEGRLLEATAQREALEHQLARLRAGSRAEEIEHADALANAATARVALEEARLARHQLLAPIVGEVLEVHARPGEIVAAGAPCVTVADTGHPLLVVFVPQQKLGGIQVGGGARVRVDACPVAFEGRVERVGRRTEFTPRFLFSERERPNLVVRVRVRLDDPEGLLHAGVPANVTFEPALGNHP